MHGGPVSCLDAFALDLFGFGVYTSPPRAAGAMLFHDPLEGTEIENLGLVSALSVPEGEKF